MRTRRRRVGTDLDKVDNISWKWWDFFFAPAEIDAMQADRNVSREGASTPYYRAALTEFPLMVVCPLPVFSAGMRPEDMQQIYQLALERAQAACRPSIWDLGQRRCMN
jgi:hypothetical protein